MHVTLVLISLFCVVFLDPSEQIWQLTRSLQQAQGENGSLRSDNERLTDEVKSLQDRVAQLEKQLAEKDKKVSLLFVV